MVPIISISPPFSVNPLQIHGLSTWANFLNLLMNEVTHLAQELRELPSEIIWLGLEKMDLDYVPQDNLAAFTPYLHALAGGCSQELPADLEAKKCVVNIANEDKQCFRCCLMAWKLKIKGPHAERWSNYIIHMPRGKHKPKGWTPTYKDCGLDLRFLPFDRASACEDIAFVELGIYVYKWHTAKIDTENGSLEQNFQVLVRAPPEPLKITEETPPAARRTLLPHPGPQSLPKVCEPEEL